jgi:hypothetical protein
MERFFSAPGSNMADMSQPVVQIRENGDGTWDVSVSVWNARKKQYGSFQTEREAKKCGQSQALKWLDRHDSSIARVSKLYLKSGSPG